MKALVIRAGAEARRQIERDGLGPESFSHMGAAAGGPKWLILNRLDRALFGDWLKQRRQALFAVGSSAGAWRLACAAQRDPGSALDRLERAYIEQRYGPKPSPREVSDTARGILDVVLGTNGAAEILAHRWLSLNIIVTRGRGWVAHDQGLLQKTALLGAVAGNLVDRRLLGLFFQRTIFHTPGASVAMRADAFRTHAIPLTVANLPQALLASGTIPMVMAPVRDIVDAVQGGYLDGGMIDYHMDLPLADHDGMVFLPHFSERVTTGWLDKFLPWRKPRELSRTLLIAPSREFVATLPQRRIPDRHDFYRYAGRDDARIRDWRTCVAEGQRLADEWMELVTRGNLGARLEPL